MADKDALQQMYVSLLTQATIMKTEPIPTTLTNKDFENGTYIISKPGTYRLIEDIVFNPNNLRQMNQINPLATSYESGDVLPHQFTYTGGKYDPAAFGIGFFAAITVTTDEPTLIDLNGRTLKQSKEHALQQRFFSLIELTDQPFVSGQGPHDFGKSIKPAKNCYIINGKLGLSSHHGIHGNACENILISNVTFSDYEVAPCAINGGTNIAIVNCIATGSRSDLPIVGIFSSGRFIRPFLNNLVNNGYTGELNINGVGKDANTIKMELKDAMNNVYDDLIIKRRNTIDQVSHLKEWRLFHNPSGVIDGNSYGFIFNGLGVAVLGFPKKIPIHPSSNIYMNNVIVKNHQAKINEILALPSASVNTRIYGSGVAQIDPVGSVFQTQNKDGLGNFITINQNNQYLGNVVANAQAIVAKAIYDNFSFPNLDTSRFNISTQTIKWVNGHISFNELLPYGEFVCNGDSMFHVNKGVVIFKIDGCQNVYLTNCIADVGYNYGSIGSNKCAQDYINQIALSHPDATYFGYNGANLRGWSIASSKNVTLEDCQAKNLTSSYGTVYGFDIHQASKDIQLISCLVDTLSAGPSGADSNQLTLYNNNPTSKPQAIGYHCQKNAIDVTFCEPITKNLMAIYQTIPMSINCNSFYEVSKCDLDENNLITI